MTTCPKFPLRLTTASAIVLASITLGGLVACGGGSRTATVALPPLVGAGDTTGSKVMSWFAQVADSLHEVALGVVGIAEGNVAAGVSEFAAAGFGLIGKGLDSGDPGSGDDQAQQLNTINGKLDTLISNVNAIATNVAATEQAVESQTDLETSTAAMRGPMTDAGTWLDNYYTGPNQTLASRAWANWSMAGCDATPSPCSLPPYPAVTAASLAKFRSAYMQNPAKSPMTNSTDNFPLWWAYSVLPELTTGSAHYNVGGFTADQLQEKIYTGIVSPIAADPNGLVSYMRYFLTQGGNICATDVANPACDLYTSVYQPLEAYFALAIGRQSQLVTARTEAWTVLAQLEPVGHATGGNDVVTARPLSKIKPSWWGLLTRPRVDWLTIPTRQAAMRTALWWPMDEAFTTPRAATWTAPPLPRPG